MLSGGGTGGHTMPLIAVADALKKTNPFVELVAVGEKKAGATPLRDDIETHYIYSGKYRRYYGESLISRLNDWQTLALNVRDIFKVVAGFFQSIALLRRHQPDIIVIKGGYVSLPLGFAAQLLGIDYITHDSDTVPGLTNRLLAKDAIKNLVAFPVEHYSYQRNKVLQSGLPIRALFDGVTRSNAREQLEISPEQKRIVIIGGSLGAQKLNLAVAQISHQLGELSSVLHITGRGDQYQQTEASYTPHPNYELTDFVYEDVAQQLAAADVVVTRAGATTLAELSAVGACSIVVPHPLLTDAHQLKNAEAVNSYDAGIIIQQDMLVSDPKLLLATVDELLNDSKRRAWLGENLGRMFRSNAAENVAKVVADVVDS